MSEPLAALFSEFVKERRYLKAVSPKTEVWYWTAWKAFEGAVGPGPLDKPRLQRFVVALRDRGLNPRSVNSYLQCINAFSLWLRDEHGLEGARLPLLKVPSKLPRTFGDRELRLLLSYRPRTPHERRTHALVLTLIDTGCRIAEALKLEPSDVDMDNLLLTFRGKGGRERKVPFSPELRRVLYRHMKGNAGPYVFCSRNGTAITQRNALRDYYRLKEKVGLPHAGGFHQLRHTFATGYLRNGGEIVRLSRHLGHSQLSTTMKYVHLATEDLRETHRKVSPLSRLA